MTKPTADASPMVTVRDLYKTYQSEVAEPIAACRGIDITVDRREAVAIVGASGSGKSTLLHLIGSLDVPDSGTVQVGDLPVTSLGRSERARYRRETVGFVFQRFHLLPTLSVLDNVLAPLLPYHAPFNKRARAHELLEAVGLADRAKALPSKLSGGQQQRVAIARALLNDPPLLLADEPTGNLDTQTGEDIMSLLLATRDRRGTTLMVATHNPSLAAQCDRIIQISDGAIVSSEDATKEVSGS